MVVTAKGFLVCPKDGNTRVKTSRTSTMGIRATLGLLHDDVSKSSVRIGGIEFNLHTSTIQRTEFGASVVSRTGCELVFGNVFICGRSSAGYDRDLTSNEMNTLAKALTLMVESIDRFWVALKTDD